ncbi:MAG: DUF3995 domain-containing protein [Nitrospira sp.]|nr:DUF3995 domain-containing protein [Nitrospira sp.]
MKAILDATTSFSPRLANPLALVLLLRAIGDFRLVGFWNRIRDTCFARLDTALYSPLCLALAIRSAVIGFAGHG